MTLAYNHLYDFVRKERAHQELQDLPATFYADAKQFFDELQVIVRHDPFSPKGDAARLQVSNGKKLLKQLYDYREQKILLLAQNKCRTGSAFVDTSKLLESERLLYDAAVKVLSESRRKSHVEDLIEPEAAPVPQEDAKPEAPERIVVKVVKPVTQFLGKDMQTYGPFDAEQRVELPSSVADMLIRKGNAQPD
jgi:DNA replication initiation complex subunit (GINS family)